MPPAGRDLTAAFAERLASWSWDVALLQEVPPWWPPRLAADTGAEQRTALTSRNLGLPVRRLLARRRPDLMKSNGGGCNAVLSRLPIAAAFSVRLRVRPERRVAQFLTLADGTVIANYHASTRVRLAREELARLWQIGLELAPAGPLVIGGDLNLRDPAAPVAGAVHAAARDVDHVFALGLRPAAPAVLPGRAVRSGGHEHELSDHPPLLVELVPDGAGS